MTPEKMGANIQATARRDLAVAVAWSQSFEYASAERRHLELLAAIGGLTKVINEAADRVCDTVGSVVESVDVLHQDGHER